MINPFKPQIIIKGGRKNVPKNPHIFSTSPVIFETKKQYVNELIHNQEKVRGIDFPKSQEDKFRKEELKKMQPVCARYTTKSNPYMPPRMVIFTDNKISPDRLQEMVVHEQRHMAWEPFESDESSKNLIDDVIERKKEEKRQLEQATYEDPRMRERYPHLYARKSDVPKEKYSIVSTSSMTPEEHLKFLERYDDTYADYIREKRREMELKKENQIKKTGYI